MFSLGLVRKLHDLPCLKRSYSIYMPKYLWGIIGIYIFKRLFKHEKPLLFMIKKIIAILLALSMLFSVCACKREEKLNYEILGELVDGAGRTINVRSDAKDATIASVYFVAAPFFVALGLEDRVLAVNARNSFWTMASEGLGKAGTVGKGTVDLEKLASYKPTALVHRSNDPETVAAVEKLGIDVICITVENAEDIIKTLDLLGTYFGAEERAKEAKDWFNGKIEMIDNIVSTIPMEKRKTAMLIGGEPGRVAGYDMMQSWMIEKAGGISVIKEGENHNWINIGLEKVFSYNPEYIFCTSSAARNYTVDELLANPAWSAMTAVINKNIYDVPTKLDSWDMPGFSCVLGIMYMLHSMYPEYFSVSDLEDEVDDYYRFMFGRCFDKELELDWDNFK